MSSSLGSLPRRLLPVLLAAYMVLGAAGTWGGRATALRAAVAVLVLLLALALPLRRPAGFALWLVLAAALLWLDAQGRARAVLGTTPILVNAFLCALFARTLRHGREPLVTRVVRVVEGEDRLRIPGVARYARAVTAYWAILTAVQVGVLAICWLRVLRHGAAAPAAVRAWLEAGGYALPLLAMAVEYAWRRWRFRGLPHLPVHTFVRRLVACWPRILREPGSGNPP